MERYCGQLLPCVKSRRYPYISMNNYTTSRAYLTQIQLAYNLDKELLLEPEPSNRGTILDDCKSSFTLPAQSINYITDPHFLLLPPYRTLPLDNATWTKVIACLATRLSLTPSVIRNHIDTASAVSQYGRVSRTDGGDAFEAWELVPLRQGRRDSSYVRVSAHFNIVLLTYIFALDSIGSLLIGMHTVGDYLPIMRNACISDKSSESFESKSQRPNRFLYNTKSYYSRLLSRFKLVKRIGRELLTTDPLVQQKWWT